MVRHLSPELDAGLLPADAAARLLARASELDMALRDSDAVLDHHVANDVRAVTDLRTAAIQAGISARAFDVALAEMIGTEQARVPDGSEAPRRLFRMWTLAAAAATLIAVGTVALEQSWPWRPAVPTVDEAFVLRCMTAEDAVPLILPVIGDLRNTEFTSNQRTPRVLTVRTTQANMRNVRSVLAEHEGTGSPATCVPRTAPP